jgi:hypothetical protein
VVLALFVRNSRRPAVDTGDPMTVPVEPAAHVGGGRPIPAGVGVGLAAE